MITPTPILKVTDLETVFSTHRGTTKAVDKVSFEIYPGETVAIVGESGSGKSVTSLSVMRLINTPPGRIAGGTAIFQSEKFGEVDLFSLPEKQMQQIRGNDISMIFQEPMSSLNPVYTCGKQVAEVLLLHRDISEKEARERTIALFEKAKLPRPEKIYDAYPHEISGGQKQRVMIAMAMACEPSILIADEPTTALDVTVQARMLQLIDELRVKENTAVLFITHDLGVVAEIADRILVMYKGKLVEQGKVLDIFTNPQHPYTKGLLACRPKLSAKPQSILPTVSDFMLEDEFGNIIERKKEIVEPSLVDVVNNYVGTVTDIKHQQENKQKPPLLKVENLKVYFPIKKGFFGRTTDYVKAVDGVSFIVNPGETIGLVGESGCGKTTLGRALLRLVEPTEGSIIFNGRDIAQLSSEELRKSRRDFQMIFQDPYASLNPMHTVGEAIMEPMRVHKLYANDKERKAKTMELLEKVGLTTEHFQRYPHEFSGGQRQRISIARALALQPKCIICDESVSALDVSVQAQVLNLLNKLKQEFQMTYIFITHDLSVAKYMSDRILVMSKGQIVESGTPQQLYLNPKEEYTRTLINAIPKGEVEDIIKAQEKRELMKAGQL
ncbi:ABC transporter ATP-binding protein [Pontibacter sp. BT310]|uniref:ABC transporter ATP-binding protein n=1 Tax=Pontibacter populi TaxID=890055 RepID=A0ABS6X8Y3_9BACT|nr:MULTISPECIES: ABC transporter ATP-binding protein [Pontibacter]MBJ6117615.1 ABC transporter ATP-binding protein [Pontibacter sp. BT310]MBR0570040.1 ABC transporter ATP-binding protein [Microvirga sp. STS03]MBW3364467.1 ABC transporter ATP-binding protein [Pontibacter populi]